jgi:DNA-binding CsgD family transcriptional regulator
MAFSQRHDLFHIMAQTMELPGSGMMFFVSLYRGKDSPAFDDNEGAMFAEFAKHLLHHWQACVQDVLGNAPSRSFENFALADTEGELIYLGKRLSALIQRSHLGWSGSKLPADMRDALRQVPGAISVGGCGLTLQPCGDLISLALDSESRRPQLPPRERTVAILYAQGQSYKVIAKQLNLSPATVRTYLRNAYLQLGVCNKIELSAALHATSALRHQTVQVAEQVKLSALFGSPEPL